MIFQEKQDKAALVFQSLPHIGPLIEHHPESDLVCHLGNYRQSIFQRPQSRIYFLAFRGILYFQRFKNH